MTPDRVAILNEYNRLIEACNNDEIKKQLYTLSNKFMATENQNQPGWFGATIAVLGPILGNLAKHEIDALIEHIQSHNVQVQAETETCNGVAMPTQPPQGHTLGHYYCTKDGWQWEDEIGPQ